MTTHPNNPYHAVLLVEDLSRMSPSEEFMYNELNQATMKYSMKMSVREYDPFNIDDITNVAYLPSYHIYKRSKLKATHTSFEKIERRITHYSHHFEKAVTRRMLRHLQQR